jgi:hypothetical protein
MSRWVFLNWDIYTDWLGWCPDIRVYLVPEDLQ